MSDLGRYLRLTGLMMKNCLIREMQFKSNFFVRLLTEFMWLGMQFIYIGVIYGQANSIVGWSMWEMVVLAGTNHVITQLFEALFYDNCTRLTDQIRQGDLDFNRIKPINTQFLCRCVIPIIPPSRIARSASASFSSPSIKWERPLVSGRRFFSR